MFLDYDYINASWVRGYYSPKDFIATQVPTPNTVPDFWQMISENDARIIIMLSGI